MANNKHKIIILGAGVAGLAAGVEFRKQNIQCLILEKANKPGGLCQSVNVGPCDFDYGPKILLLDNSEYREDILGYLDGNFEKYPVTESAFLSEFGLLDFPIQRYLINLPKSERELIIADIDNIRKSPMEVINYKAWLINAFGEYFCEKIMFPYEEKKWQINLDDLDYKWALNRPLKVDYEEILRGAETKLPPKNNYYYPKKGNIEALIQGMVKNSCEMRLNQEVININIQDRYLETKTEKYYFEKLISTIPITDFLRLTGDSNNEFRNSAKYLRGLGILVINLVYKGNYNIDGTAIYFPEKKFIFRRVTVLQNLCPALSRSGYTPIQLEVSINGSNDTNEIISQSLVDLAKIKQFSKLGKPEYINSLKIDFAYPLPMTGLEDYIGNIHSYFAKKEIYHCGRGGNYVYCNLDKAYKQGIELARKLIVTET